MCWWCCKYCLLVKTKCASKRIRWKFFYRFLVFQGSNFLNQFRYLIFFSDQSAKFLLWFASFFPKYFPEKRCFLFSTKSQVIGLYQFFFEKVFFSNCLFEREETQTSWSELSLWHRQTVHVPVVSFSFALFFLNISKWLKSVWNIEKKLDC